MRTRREYRGSMLVDWSTAASLVAAAAMFAVPGLQTFIHESQRCAVVNQLQRDMRLAATKASQLGQTVTLCASAADSERCAGHGDWSGGWIAFVDMNGDGTMQKDESRLRLWKSVNDQANIVVTASAESFSFRPYFARPYLGTEPGQVVVCDREGHGGSRVVEIDRAGAPRLGAEGRNCNAAA
jgi:type IV fimbrial biogenesis protein FimT